jgi:hypothetical protein
MKLTSDTPSKTAFADHVLAGELSPTARKQVTRLRDEWRANPAVVVRRSTACKMLDSGATRERELERSGAIDSFLDGSVRLIIVSSIYTYLIEQALASHPLDKPARKAPGGPDMARVRALSPVGHPRPAESPGEAAE